MGCLLLLIALASCSFKTVYNNFDYLIPEYLDGMVPLDKLLEEEVDNNLGMFLEWHRKTQLKEYVTWMRNIQKIAGPHITRNEVYERIADTNVFWRSISSRLNQGVAEVLPKMSEQQQSSLFANLREMNEEFREEYIDRDSDERARYYADTLIENYEFWLGDLTDEQERYAIEATSKQVDTAELRLQRRIIWQNEVREILNEDISIEDQSRKLQQFLQGFKTINTAKFREISDYNRKIIVDLTVSIARSMTDEQIEYIHEELEYYIQMFIELSENR
jgi:hypothetical protein